MFPLRGARAAVLALVVNAVTGLSGDCQPLHRLFGTVIAVPTERHEVSEVGRVSIKARPAFSVSAQRVRPFEKLQAAIL